MTQAVQRAPESQESRTLGKFATDKFDYRDQSKNLIQLNNAVGYMSGMMRKMQKGIDSANENFIQQIQGFIQDIFVLFAGGGDTGFDFGDLRYLLQMIGALFGFGSGPFPQSIFTAAWHFFSTYIIPVENFDELVNLIVDGIIATTLDIFGEVPILGQALQQLMVILSWVRDNFLILSNKWGAFIFNITDGLGEGIDYIAHILKKIFDAFIQPIIDAISQAVGGPVGRAIGWIQTKISQIFNLASGADSKATTLQKQARPLWDAVDGNGDTSVNISSATSLLVVNQTNSRGAFIPSVLGGVKQTVSFLASKTGTVTGLYIDVYALTLSNTLQKLHTSADLSSALLAGAGNEVVIFHEIPEADWFFTTQNNYYLVVARMVGGGSVNLQGVQYPVANSPQRPLYPGFLRNPTGNPNPDTLSAGYTDAAYNRDTPYFQLGNLAGILPQSYYCDFSTVSDNLWFRRKKTVSGFGSVNYQRSQEGVLDIPAQGNSDGRAWITHRFHTATERCRVAVRPAHRFEPNNRATFVSLFSELDKASGIGLKLVRDSDVDSIQLAILTNDGSIAPVELTEADHANNNWAIAYGWPDMLYAVSGTFNGKWIYLEYDPTDNAYRGYIDPDFSNPNYRTRYHIESGMFMELFADTMPQLAAVGKSSISRSSTILQRVIWSSGPGGIDDWILEDWKEPDAPPIELVP